MPKLDKREETTPNPAILALFARPEIIGDFLGAYFARMFDAVSTNKYALVRKHSRSFRDILLHSEHGSAEFEGGTFRTAEPF